MQQSIRNHRFWATGAILVTCILWGLAVALPVWDTRSERTGDWGVVQGALPAVIGFLGIVVLCPAWYANLLLVPLFILLFKKRRGGFVLSLVALAVAASAYILQGIYGDDATAVIMRRLIGFYLWLASFVVIALAFAILANQAQPKLIAVRVGLVFLIVLGIAGLEKICPVGVSPLETALKTPDDLTAFTAALSHNPSQADKDSALLWALRQELSQRRSEPSKRITMLIAAGANPNASYKSGDNLLIMSVKSEAYVKLLVQAGANVNARDGWGKTVLDIAIQSYSSPECQKILVDAGARSSGQK